jgi:NADPH:quinone reductase-like Zn-dependent oxidoreductase
MNTQAYRFTAAGSADWIALDSEYPVNDLGPNDVRIRMKACSLNYRDLIHAKKQLGRDFAGQVPLSDGAGEVVAVGSGVTQVSVGVRVAGIFFQSWLNGRFEMKHHDSALGGSANGMLAKEVVLNEKGVVRIPDYLTFEEAATLPCAAVTVWQSLVVRGGVKTGDTVLALGTGGVSIFALQIAVAMGGTVVITSSSDEKLAKAKALGAAHGVNYKTTPDWDKEVWKWTGKRGVDQVVEVGGSGTLGKSLATLKTGGHIALVGVLTGVGPPDASLFPLVSRNATMSGIYVGSREHFEAMNRFLTEKKIKPVIDRAFDFADAQSAFRYLESGSHFGKVVISIPA